MEHMIGAGGSDCPFCDKIKVSDVTGRAHGAVWFTPLNPVTPGHILFVPEFHIKPTDPNAWLDGMLAIAGAIRAYRVEMYTLEDFNLILNSGPLATQTVEHMHVHYLPRFEDDGVILPWTPITTDMI